MLVVCNTYAQNKNYPIASDSNSNNIEAHSLNIKPSIIKFSTSNVSEDSTKVIIDNPKIFQGIPEYIYASDNDTIKKYLFPDISGFLNFEYFHPVKNDSSETVSVSNRYKLQYAVDSAAKSHLKLIISGTYYFDSSVIINGNMHHFEITGDKGAKLILKSRVSDNMKRPCFYFQDSAGLKPHDIAFRNFTIDGNKQGNENLISGTEGGGVRMRDTSINSNSIFEGMTFQNCWANGINIYDKWVYVGNCSFLGNWNSGLGSNPGSGVIANNIVSMYNKGRGVDASGGKMIINNLISMYNSYGMKTSQEQSFFQADNVNLSFNDSIGFNQTDTPDSCTIQIGKMRVEGNGIHGVSIDKGKSIHVSDLILINNNILGFGNTNNDLKDANIDNLYIEEKGTLPALTVTSGNANINNIKAINNTGSSIINVIAGSSLNINSGLFTGNKSIGIKSYSNNNFVSLHNIIFSDSAVNNSIDLAGASAAYVQGCNFINKLGGKIAKTSPVTFVSRDNFGYDAAATGSGTISTSDITWNGTAPSSPTSLIYNFSKNENNEVTLHVLLDYATAGNSNKTVAIAFNPALPVPVQRITGASTFQYSGSGFLATNDSDGNLPTGRCVIRRNAANTGYELRILQAGISAKFAMIDITYTAQ